MRTATSSSVTAAVVVFCLLSSAALADQKQPPAAKSPAKPAGTPEHQCAKLTQEAFWLLQHSPKRNKHELAVTSIERCLELTADKPAAIHLSNAAAIHRQAGNFTRAIDLYRQALALDENDANGWANLGQMLLDAKNASAAVSALENVAKLRFGVPLSEPFLPGADFDVRSLINAAAERDAADRAAGKQQVAGAEERVRCLRHLLHAKSRSDGSSSNIEQTRNIHRLVLSLPQPPPPPGAPPQQSADHAMFGQFSIQSGAFGEGFRHMKQQVTQDVQGQRTMKRMQHRPLPQQQQQPPKLHNQSPVPPPPPVQVKQGGEVDPDIAESVSRQLMLFVSSQLEAHLTSIIRTLLRGGRLDVRREVVSSLIGACMRVQGVVEEIAQGGADMNVANAYGYSPIFHMILLGDLWLVQKLLEFGANPNLQTQQGLSPLHLASIYNQPRILRALVDAGGDLTLRDAANRMPIDLAFAHSQRWSESDAREFCAVFALDDYECARKRLQLPWLHQAERNWAADPAVAEIMRQEAAFRSEVGNGGWRAPTVQATQSQSQQTVAVEVPAAGQADALANMASVSSSSSSLNSAESPLLPLPPVQKCDIEIRWRITTDEFVRDYLSAQRPVLIKGVMSDPIQREDWAAQLRAMRREAFAPNFGAFSTKISSVPYADTFNLASSKSNVSLYLQYMDHQASLPEAERDFDPAYIFHILMAPRGFKPRIAGKPGSGKSQPSKSTDDKLIERVFMLPNFLDPVLLNTSYDNVQFYLGGKDTGAPVHFHSGAANTLLYGRKRWILFPPRRGLYSKKSIHSWLRDDLPLLQNENRPLECIQEQGDVVFLPDSWAHAVLNLAESIGVAAEFLWGPTRFQMIEPPDLADPFNAGVSASAAAGPPPHAHAHARDRP